MIFLLKKCEKLIFGGFEHPKKQLLDWGWRGGGISFLAYSGYPYQQLPTIQLQLESFFFFQNSYVPGLNYVFVYSTNFNYHESLLAHFLSKVT